MLCKIGRSNRCVGREKRILGSYKASGTFAKYVSVPSKILHKIPKSLSLDEAAIAEPVACAIHCVSELTEVCIGDTVVILGPGTMGLITLQVAKSLGAKHLFITGLNSDKERLALAQSLGADRTINVQEENPIEIIMDLTNGLGADVVFEASGSLTAREQAFQLIRRCGKIGLIGLSGKPMFLNMDKIVEKELEVRGSWGTLWTSWKKALSMLTLGSVKVNPLITTKLAIENWEKGFELIDDGKALKVLLIPD